MTATPQENPDPTTALFRNSHTAAVRQGLIINVIVRNVSPRFNSITLKKKLLQGPQSGLKMLLMRGSGVNLDQWYLNFVDRDPLF